MDRYKDGNQLYLDGKVESGTIVHGMNLTLVPSGDSITIHHICNSDDKKIPYAKPGENIKINIKGLDEDKVARGDIICSTYSFCQVAYVIECAIKVLDLPEHKPIMSNGYQCIMHLHAALEEVYIKEIVSQVEKTTAPSGEKPTINKKSVRFLRSGQAGIVRIEALNNALCCEKFEDMPQLGRFTLRDEGTTIAIGQIKRVKTLFKD